MVPKHANISWPTNQPKFLWVLSITVPQPIKSHEPYQQILDTNSVQNIVSSRSIVTRRQNQQSPALDAKVCL